VQRRSLGYFTIRGRLCSFSTRLYNSDVSTVAHLTSQTRLYEDKKALPIYSEPTVSNINLKDNHPLRITLEISLPLLGQKGSITRQLSRGIHLRWIEEHSVGTETS